MNALVATGAYGRTANQKDWDAGKDFKKNFRVAHTSANEIANH